MLPVIDLTICDSPSCGACGLPSDGCSVVLAISDSELVFSTDGGLSFGVTNLSFLATAMACIGSYVVIISADSSSCFYTPLVDIFNGVEVWVEVTTGFVIPGEPQHIWSSDSAHTWIVGLDGYIYFMSDVIEGVLAQSSGELTLEDLFWVHGFDPFNVVACGDNNVVLNTKNGGDTWELIDGPELGINLSVIQMKTLDEWWVGSTSGRLFYTLNGGASWTEKLFPGSGIGSMMDIKWYNKTLGYIVHYHTILGGRVFRTIDGGHSWYLLPEGVRSFPLSTSIEKVSLCEDPNIVYAGGSKNGGVDGYIVKGA